MIKLTPRLSAVASFVRKGAGLADVGTDHGYIPVYLVMNDLIKSAVAGDIGVLPLKSAENTIENYGLSERIKTVLSDGLDCFNPDCTDDIVIAGMGGDLIVKILGKAEWIKDENKHLILQPMTHTETVRQYLNENGFYIEKEISVNEGEKVYIIMSVYYDGKTRKTDEFYCLFGNLDNSDISDEYRRKQLNRIEKKRAGAICSHNNAVVKYCDDIIKKYGDKYG